MTIVWHPIPEFPNYSISDRGVVLNHKFDREVVQYANSRGTAMVGLYRDGAQYKRAVSPIVAKLFLPPPPEDQATPINLDGDRFNNRVENLMWRPLWFARKYHRQFANEICIPVPIEDMDTRKQFDNSRKAAVMYGLLEREIRVGIMNRIPVWPTFQFFRIVRN